LDSETELILDSLYNVTALYDGADFEIYINGKLDALATFSGSILQTNINFLIGQVLPGNNQYNFKGVLDDIRIYDYALSFQEIKKFYDIVTSVDDQSRDYIPDQNILYQNYPNPFNSHTIIKYQIKEAGIVILEIFNVIGEKVRTLVNKEEMAGYYSIPWDGRDAFGEYVTSGIYFYRLRINNFMLSRKLVILK